MTVLPQRTDRYKLGPYRILFGADIIQFSSRKYEITLANTSIYSITYGYILQLIHAILQEPGSLKTTYTMGKSFIINILIVYLFCHTLWCQALLLFMLFLVQFSLSNQTHNGCLVNIYSAEQKIVPNHKTEYFNCSTKQVQTECKRILSHYYSKVSFKINYYFSCIRLAKI